MDRDRSLGTTRYTARTLHSSVMLGPSQPRHTCTVDARPTRPGAGKQSVSRCHRSSSGVRARVRVGVGLGLGLGLGFGLGSEPAQSHIDARDGHVHALALRCLDDDLLVAAARALA
eukprot:scaffold55282_cov60-Phaeocystis_antarctica.AAC.7